MQAAAEVLPEIESAKKLPGILEFFLKDAVTFTIDWLNTTPNQEQDNNPCIINDLPSEGAFFLLRKLKVTSGQDLAGDEFEILRGYVGKRVTAIAHFFNFAGNFSKSEVQFYTTDNLKQILSHEPYACFRVLPSTMNEQTKTQADLDQADEGISVYQKEPQVQSIERLATARSDPQSGINYLVETDQLKTSDLKPFPRTSEIDIHQPLFPTPRYVSISLDRLVSRQGPGIYLLMTTQEGQKYIWVQVAQQEQEIGYIAHYNPSLGLVKRRATQQQIDAILADTTIEPIAIVDTPHFILGRNIEPHLISTEKHREPDQASPVPKRRAKRESRPVDPARKLQQRLESLSRKSNNHEEQLLLEAVKAAGFTTALLPLTADARGFKLEIGDFQDGQIIFSAINNRIVAEMCISQASIANIWEELPAERKLGVTGYSTDTEQLVIAALNEYSIDLNPRNPYGTHLPLTPLATSGLLEPSSTRSILAILNPPDLAEMPPNILSLLQRILISEDGNQRFMKILGFLQKYVFKTGFGV